MLGFYFGSFLDRSFRIIYSIMIFVDNFKRLKLKKGKNIYNIFDKNL